MTTKVWLLPLETASRRTEQSARARELLKTVCDWEGIELGKKALSLPGLQLIEYFSANLGVGLSIAHCSRMIAVALAGAAVGIDCEQSGRRRNWLGIARQFFTVKEAQAIAEARSDQQESVFLHHWVLKEAYLKASRGSIFGDLNRLVLERPHRAKIDGNPAAQNWRGWKLELLECPIAVCSAAGGSLTISQVQALASGAIGSQIIPLSTSMPREIELEIPKRCY